MLYDAVELQAILFSSNLFLTIPYTAIVHNIIYTRVIYRIPPGLAYSLLYVHNNNNVYD